MGKSKKRILIISGEAWREESNGGNVLNNLFSPLRDEFEFAQIYTNPALPSNKLCCKYFHLSEALMLKSVISRKSFGKKLEEKDYSSYGDYTVNNLYTSKGVLFLKKYFINVLYFFQNLLWHFSVWKSDALRNFVLEYEPDIIFAPLYSGLFIHKIDRYVSKLTRKKLISYVSDDVYTLRQFSISPFFWINRFILRKNVQKTSLYYSLLYTMTKEQKDEYEKKLKVQMKILKKVGDFEQMPHFKEPGTPIQLTYGGNLFYNRYRTLHQLFTAIKEINQDEKKFQLNIYTQTPLTPDLKKLLHDGQNSFLFGKVSRDELMLKYEQSDIVLHVESFDLKQRLITRLSFSTKIVDLLNSARCILAICWSESSPYKYLKSEDAAICISDISTIKNVLIDLYTNKHKITEYSRKAWDCGIRNHNSKDILAEFKKDLISYSNEII